MIDEETLMNYYLCGSKEFCKLLLERGPWCDFTKSYIKFLDGKFLESSAGFKKLVAECSEEQISYLFKLFYFRAQTKLYQREPYFNELSMLGHKAAQTAKGPIVGEIYYTLAVEYDNADHFELATRALRVASKYVKSNEAPILYEKVHNTLREIGKNLSSKLSSNEKILFDALYEKPMSKFELIDLIFKDHNGAQGRFKSLLYRFKKKIPGQVYLNTDGEYVLEID